MNDTTEKYFKNIIKTNQHKITATTQNDIIKKLIFKSTY